MSSYFSTQLYQTSVSDDLSNNKFSRLVGNKCHRSCPGGLLPAPPPLPLCGWQLSISVNHQSSPFSPTPRSARWALNWCLVLRYQMARQMTSPWPHYTRTQRRGGVLTEQRADPTHATSLHANPWNSCMKRVLKTAAFIYIPTDFMNHFIECKWIFIPFYFFLPTPQYWLSLSVIIQHSLSSLQSLLTDRTWKEEGAWLSTSHEKQR